MKLTGTDIESGHRTGGVGGIAKAPRRLVEAKPATPAFAEFDSMDMWHSMRLKLREGIISHLSAFGERHFLSSLAP